MTAKEYNDKVWRNPETLASMQYLDTYHYVKVKYCSCGRCKHDGECENCEHQMLRRYAARDTDYIHELLEENKRLKKQLEKKHGRTANKNRKV